MARRQSSSEYIAMLLATGVALIIIILNGAFGPLAPKHHSRSSSKEEDNSAAVVHSTAQDVGNQVLLRIKVYPKLHTTSTTISLSYVHNPHHVCLQQESMFDILMIVHSETSHFTERKAIRNTWGSIASRFNNTGYFRLVFLLGVGPTYNETLREQVSTEYTNHRDIIQIDFLDTYLNLTLKSILMLKWVNDFCPNVRMIVKSDDDAFVNTPVLVEHLDHCIGKEDVIIGKEFRPSLKRKRKEFHKWYLPPWQYPYDQFPPYVAGLTYCISRNLVPRILQATSIVPFLPIEDLYITGFCAFSVHAHLINSFPFTTRARNPTGCDFRYAINGHKVNTTNMYKIWSALQNNDFSDCDTDLTWK